MQTDMLSSRQVQLETIQLITQLRQKIVKLSTAEREAVSLELRALKSYIESITPPASSPVFDNEIALRLSEERFRLASQALQGIVYDWDIVVENQKAILEVQDNGVGFKVPSDLLNQTQMGHYGLASMKERAETVGGAFSVRSQPGEGTVIQAVVPLVRA